MIEAARAGALAGRLMLDCGCQNFIAGRQQLSAGISTLFWINWNGAFQPCQPLSYS
jgi:hypothetical protein